MTEMKKVLIVDDEADVRAYLSRLLKENGYAVVTAADGVEAMEKIRAERPAVVTLDMSMPNKSGVKFYREIREDAELKNVPVIVVTGVTGVGKSSDFERFLSTRSQFPPPERFIAKPIEPEEILEAVRGLA